MSRKKQKELLENVEILQVAAEGKALAKVNDKVLFVPWGIPGDIVNVQVTKARHSFMEGYITEVVKPSAIRVEPFCQHFGVCGGCKWQSLPYEKQIAFKQQQVVDQLIRIGHLQLPEISPILGSERTTFYRNKLEFTFSNKRWLTKEETLRPNDIVRTPALGFHITGLFDKVLDIEKCWLQRDPSNAIRLAIKEYALAQGLSFFDLREQTGFMRDITIRTNESGDVMLTVVFAHDCEERGENDAARKALLEYLRSSFPEIKSLNYVINTKMNDSYADLPVTLYSGNEAIYEQMENLRFKIGPKSFYQTNAAQAYRLYSKVREFAALTGKELVYDLYTGTGTIALFVSAFASKVIGIEYVPEAIEDAKVNAALNGISNVAFYAGDMKDILTEGFVRSNGRPDVVIVDPPRAGMHPSVVDVLIKAAPRKIVYVSCNPATQARDLQMLNRFYEITAVQPVDMFPHTHHVENIVCAVRREKPLEVVPVNNELSGEDSNLDDAKNE